MRTLFFEIIKGVITGLHQSPQEWIDCAYKFSIPSLLLPPPYLFPLFSPPSPLLLPSFSFENLPQESPLQIRAPSEILLENPGFK